MDKRKSVGKRDESESVVSGRWSCLQRRVGGYSPFPVYLVLECMTENIGGVKGARLKTTSIFFRGDETFFYAKSADEFDSRTRDEVETQRRMLAALDEDAAYPQRCLQRFEAKSREFLKFCASFDGAASFSDDEVREAHGRYSRYYRDLSFDGEPVAFMLQQPLANKIEAIVKAKSADSGLKEKPGDVLIALSTPGAPSFVKREELDLLAAAASVAEGTKTLDEAAAAHSADYDWLEYDYEGSLLPRAHFEKLLREAIAAANGNPKAKLDKLKKAGEESVERRLEIESALGLTEKEKTLFASLRACSQIMDLKKEVFSRSHVKLKKLLDEAGKRIEMTSKQLLYFTAPEFPAVFENPAWAKKTFAERRESSLWISSGGATSVFSGGSPVVAKFAEYAGWGVITPHPVAGEVKGLAASSGIARGPCRVVLRADECGCVQSGDVLVSIMTTVGFVPAMKRAAAIVTDEGGVTCHAAIVARELGVPCVVATKNATVVFKDGEVIEVDANRGTVKKVS